MLDIIENKVEVGDLIVFEPTKGIKCLMIGVISRIRMHDIDVIYFGLLQEVNISINVSRYIKIDSLIEKSSDRHKKLKHELMIAGGLVNEK